MRISRRHILAATFVVAAMAMMPVSLLLSAGGTHFQSATGATSATITVTVTLTPASVTISGSTDIVGAILTYGTQDSTATAGALGAYAFDVPYNWSGVVTPILTGYTFTPDHRNFTNVLADTSGIDFTPSLIVNVEQDLNNGIPEEYSLGQNYPNPFNPSTAIPFALPRNGFATLKVYNIVGQEVACLVAAKLPAGVFRATWDGKDMSGKPVSSGVYLYRLKAGDYVEFRKMLLMK